MYSGSINGIRSCQTGQNLTQQNLNLLLEHNLDTPGKTLKIPKDVALAEADRHCYQEQMNLRDVDTPTRPG